MGKKRGGRGGGGSGGGGGGGGVASLSLAAGMNEQLSAALDVDAEQELAMLLAVPAGADGVRASCEGGPCGCP